MPIIKIPNLDKFIHFNIYLALAIMMFYGWKKQNTIPALHQNGFIKIVLLASVYGISIEIMQEFFTATRHFDLLDVASNSAGAFAGSLISVKLFK